VSLLSLFASAKRDVRVARIALTAAPLRRGRTQEPIHGGTFFVCRSYVPHVEIH
jgi:hypothetical protein